MTRPTRVPDPEDPWCWAGVFAVKALLHAPDPRTAAAALRRQGAIAEATRDLDFPAGLIAERAARIIEAGAD